MLVFESPENTLDYVRNYNTYKIRARYNDISYHGVRSVWLPFQTLYHGVRMCVFESTSAWQFRRWQTGPLFHQELIPHLRQGFHCVNLDLEDGRFLICSRNSDFQWLPELLFGFFMNTDISHLLAQFSSLSSSRGENTWKYKAIHEIAVNLDNLLSFSWVILVWARYPSYPSQGYPSDANSHKETKEVWTLQPKPSQLEEQPKLGATVQPYPVIT